MQLRFTEIWLPRVPHRTRKRQHGSCAPLVEPTHTAHTPSLVPLPPPAYTLCAPWNASFGQEAGSRTYDTEHPCDLGKREMGYRRLDLFKCLASHLPQTLRGCGRLKLGSGRGRRLGRGLGVLPCCQGCNAHEGWEETYQLLVTVLEPNGASHAARACSRLTTASHGSVLGLGGSNSDSSFACGSYQRPTPSS